MLSEELKQQLIRHPWRGAPRPVLSSDPDERLPVLRGVVRVKVFDLSVDTAVDEYQAVLQRIADGTAQLNTSEMSTDTSGNFKVYLCWQELYMCSPEYVPGEATPALRSDSGNLPVFREPGDIDTRDDEQRMRDMLAEYVERGKRPDGVRRADSVETPDTYDVSQGNVLVYSEPEVDESTGVSSDTPAQEQ